MDGFEIEKPSFGKREEEVERIPMDFAPYNNNNVIGMMRKMNYLPRMNLGKAMKEATTQALIIPTATPPFGLGYKPIDDDLLEMEVRRMARAKAKAKGLSCPSEPLKPYTPTLNGKSVKVGDSQCYWRFPKPRYDLELKTMVLGFELFFDGEDEDVRFFYEDHFDDDVDYYDGDMEDDAEAGDVNIEDGLEAKAKEIENDVDAEDEDVGDDVKAGDENVEEDVEAKGINYDESPIGNLQIGVALLMLVQDQALDMTNMVEKFLS